ncbi:TPA: hypothetical protein ENX78_11570 [Candidatus Poribacteria bacterium]|nr:hypothetical protein [Candidatus Poribacteria bacterium]
MRFSIILCITLLFVFGSQVYGLIDDFNDGNDSGWTPVQGKWSVKNKEYVQEDTKWTSTTTYETYHRSFFGDVDWTDYTVQAKVRMEGGGETAAIIGIFFRVTEKSEKGDYYYFRLDARAAEGPCLIKSPNTILLENKAKPSKLNQNYILKVEVTGDSFKCYIDDKLEMEVKDKSFPKGAIGVGTFNTQGFFDDVTVNGKGIAANAVSKNGKLTTTWAWIKKI